MFTKEVTIQSENGLHARPATAIVKQLATAKSSVFLEFNGKRAQAKSLIGILSLGLSKGDTVIVTAEGEDEEAVGTDLVNFISNLKE